MVGFTISHESVWTYNDCLFFVNNSSILSYCTDNASSLWPPSHLSPLLQFQKKNNRNKSQKVFWMKTNACRDGTLKNQSNYPYMLCHFANYTPTHLHTNNALNTVHSTAFCIQGNRYVWCSATTEVDNITDTPACHTNSTLLMDSTASVYKTDHICDAQ